jgi:hypothetical protein
MFAFFAAHFAHLHDSMSPTRSLFRVPQRSHFQSSSLI